MLRLSVDIIISKMLSWYTKISDGYIGILSGVLEKYNSISNVYEKVISGYVNMLSGHAEIFNG